MFPDSVLDVPWTDRSRRGYATGSNPPTTSNSNAKEISGELGVQGGTGERTLRNSVFGSAGSGLNAIILPPPPPVAAKPLRLSQIVGGYLIHRVQPEYPLLAWQARIQGSVVLRALIRRDGKIENLQVVSGHPMLAPVLWRPSASGAIVLTT